MRICYVSRECSPYTPGGIGTYIHNVLRAMSQAGHQVTLISDFLDLPEKERAKAELRQEGISVVLPDALPDDLASCYYHANHEYADRVYRTLQRYCSEHPLDVVQFPEYRAEGFTCIRAKRLLGEFQETTLVVSCHTPHSLLVQLNNQQPFDEGTCYAIYIEDYSVRHADVITSPSQSLASYYETRLHLDHIAHGPHPLALPEITARPSRDTVRSIVFAGRLEWRKGVDLLTTAVTPVLRAHEDVVLDCYGEDTATSPFGSSIQSYLTRQCIALDIADRVHFHGRVPYDDLIGRMAAASVCVFPSRWENWPNVCLEAMSLGVPVVVSRNGGMAEIVEDGKSGFVVDPTDLETMADRVESLLGDTALSKAVGREATKRARQLCEYAACARQIEKSYGTNTTSRFESIDAVGSPPDVSVIVPFYNQGEWLEEAVRSALQSDYRNLEVIVVNDGSTEPESNAAFERLDDPRVKKISKTNGGPASALNVGVAASTGDFILPLAADDRIHQEYVRLAVQALLNNPGLAYVTCYVKYLGDSNGYWMPVGLVREVLLLGNPAASACSVFRREALQEVSGYDEFIICAEDWDLLVRLADTSWDGDVLPRSYVFYRRHADSRTDRYRVPILPSLIQYMTRKYSDFAGRHRGELLQVAVASHGEYQRAKAWIGKQDQAIRQQKQWIEKQDETIRSQKEWIDKQDEAIRQQKQWIENQDETIRSQKEWIDKQDEAVRQQTEWIEEQDETIRTQKEWIEKQDEAIHSQKAWIEKQNEVIGGQKDLIEKLRVDSQTLEAIRNSQAWRISQRVAFSPPGRTAHYFLQLLERWRQSDTET